MQSNPLKTLFLEQEEDTSVYNSLNKILDIIRKHLGMEVSFISEFINGERVIRFVNTENPDASLNEGDSDPLEESYCKRIVDQEMSNIIPDTKKHPITQKMAVTDKLSIGSYIGVPITLSSGTVYGTFCCYKSQADNSLNDRDLSFLKVVAEIASGLIEKKIILENEQRDAKQRIQTILSKGEFETYFQPIFDIENNTITGFESLSRFSSEPYRTPDIWFNEAALVGLGESLEMMAITKALSHLNEFDNETYISINTSPEYILNGALAKTLEGVDLTRIVLEVTEHAPIKDYPAFRQALRPLREHGIRLAIDDAGAGYSGFQHILELDADIIKLDISLTQNIHLERRKYLLAKALCAFSRAIGCKIVAEGIETPEEVKVLKELGVNKAQGYLLGRPMPFKDVPSFIINS